MQIIYINKTGLRRQLRLGLRLHDFVPARQRYALGVAGGSDSIWLACKNSPDYAYRFTIVWLRRAQTFAGVALNNVSSRSDRQIFADKIGILRHPANASGGTYELSEFNERIALGAYCAESRFC